MKLEIDAQKITSIEGLTFALTCAGYPEQYDVYRGAKQVGYVRLRYGRVSVSCPDHNGKTVYSYEFPDFLKGQFEDEAEREKHLGASARTIKAGLR